MASRAANFGLGVSRFRRHGSIYVAVLGVAMIIALIAMASVHLGRNEVLVLAGSHWSTRCELLSQAAIEFAIGRIKADSSWRSTFTSGAEVPSGSTWTSLGTGKIKFVLTDADGNLADDDRDVVTLKGIGRYGDATQVTTVELQPTGTALDCLTVAVHASGVVTVSSSATSDRMISSNASINVASGSIVGDAWSTGNITGTVTGTKYQSSTPVRKLPDTTTVWDYYLANGTAININSIPSQTIQNVVLSAASNPYGTKNPQGIYIVNTQGQTLRIQNSRIAATLVVISPAATTRVASLVNWAPPASNYPALLVQGDLSMEWSGGSPLVESTAGVTFNPTGTPYDGVADADTLDSYPGIITGLVYCSGNLSTSNTCVMQGLLLAGGTASIGSTLTIAYGAGPASFPPPGFARGAVMRVVPRTWLRAAQ